MHRATVEVPGEGTGTGADDRDRVDDVGQWKLPVVELQLQPLAIARHGPARPVGRDVFAVLVDDRNGEDAEAGVPALRREVDRAVGTDVGGEALGRQPPAPHAASLVRIDADRLLHSVDAECDRLAPERRTAADAVLVAAPGTGVCGPKCE